jgi:hypothetical protein
LSLHDIINDVPNIAGASFFFNQSGPLASVEAYRCFGRISGRFAGANK